MNEFPTAVRLELNGVADAHRQILDVDAFCGQRVEESSQALLTASARSTAAGGHPDPALQPSLRENAHAVIKDITGNLDVTDTQGVIWGAVRCLANSPTPTRQRALAPLLHFVATGWLCPRCGAGCAPSVQVCPCSRPEFEIDGTGRLKTSPFQRSAPE